MSYDAWPWCDACGSWHAPDNPFCKRITTRIESIEASPATMRTLEETTRGHADWFGIRFIVSAAVPDDELWIVRRDDDGTLRKIVKPIAPPAVDKPPA